MVALGLGGCGFNTLSTSETDVVVTIEDEKRDYSDYKTYALTNEIVDLCEIAGEDGQLPLGGSKNADLQDCFDIKHTYDDLVLDTIADNMKALGYTKVDADEEPDVTLLVAAVARDNWYYASGYWWCDPFYLYSCWYPPVSYVYNLPTGTILINMVDNSETANNRLQSAWFAALSGLYANASDKSMATRIEDAVNRAFTQSPYLEAGQ